MRKTAGKSYKTGINKQPVSYPVHVDENGLVGDSICNGKYHGGHEQAVYIRVARRWSGGAGTSKRTSTRNFGENLVIEGLDNREVCVGDRFLLAGGVLLEATSPRVPCNTFAAHMTIQRSPNSIPPPADPAFIAAFSAREPLRRRRRFAFSPMKGSGSG